jgi:uncharacterized protein YndB with AHSA1/START domain
MTTPTITPAPVRRILMVKASAERAFEVFTAGFGRWWPASHKIGPAALRTAVIEPRVGGRWYEVDEDGTEVDWGEVLTWEPPSRLVLVWRIDADFRCDPDLHTEVELRFIAETPMQTRIEFEHRLLERLGDRAGGGGGPGASAPTGGGGRAGGRCAPRSSRRTAGAPSWRPSLQPPKPSLRVQGRQTS